MKIKKSKNIKTEVKIFKNECECPKNSPNDWTNKILKTNKEEEIIENVTKQIILRN